MAPREAASGLPARRRLLGRVADVDRVLGALEDGERLLTLLGPPGIGKTSLGIEAAHRWSERHPTGAAVFVDLSTAHDSAELCLAVVGALGQTGVGGSMTTPAQVAALLAARGDLLLVLDNFEQLVSAAPAVRRWWDAAPGLRMVVTSRERLAVEGESVTELQPLSCPAPDASPDALCSSAAVDLFRARVEQAGGRGGDDLEAIGEIVRRLSGIPLAIEIAAARTRLIPPADLAERLARGDDLLIDVPQRSQGRHRTLARAIEWSWDLLDERERIALVSCALLPGSFTIHAAETLLGEALRAAGLSVDGGPPPLELIAALRDKSLLHPIETDRLGIYLSIRELAVRKLEAWTPERVTAWRDAHARLFGSLAARFNHSRLLQDRRPDPTLHATARGEREHLVAAVRYLDTRAATGELQAVLVELVVAVAFLGAIPAEAADELIGVCLSHAATLSPEAQARLRLARQTTRNLLGRYDDCAAEERAIGRLEPLSLGLRAFALVNTGALARARGEVDEAWQLHLRARDLLGEGEDFPRVHGLNLACMGRLQCDLAHPELARELNGRATELCDRLGDRWLAGLGLANLAQLEQEEQRFDRAEELLDRALRRFRETGEPQYEAIYAAIRGGLHFEWGHPAEARHWYDLGESTLRWLPLPFPGVLLHGGRAALEAVGGNPPDAAHHLELARRHAVRAPSPLVRLLLELSGAIVEVSRSEGAPAVLDPWRRRLAALARPDDEDGRLVRSHIDVRFPLRMLRLILAGFDEDAAASPVLLVQAEALWFSVGDGRRVDLSRRGSLRRILVALVEARDRRPGHTLDQFVLTERGWPDEKVQVEAASTRVRVAIATLRKLGLREVLLTRDDGYLLDPLTPIERG